MTDMMPTSKGMRGRTRRALQCSGLSLALAIAVPAAGARAAQEDYRISVGDVVSFDFLDDALPAEQLTVSSDGQLGLPLLGSFPVEGRTVSEALDAMRGTFVQRGLFLDPKIALSVVGFRPIFVLGDVKLPGSFPYQPMLTVEQAVALAGGQSSGGATAEDRIVARARLRGTLDEAAVELAREAVASARVSAQLAGNTTISRDDLPAKVRPLVDAAAVSALMPTEQRILDIELRAFETRRTQLAAAVEEVKGALANLAELGEKQKSMIVAAKQDVDRAKELGRRGIKTVNDISAAERDLTAQDGHLLEIFNQMSTTRRELGDLQRQLADATDNRTRTALGELQGHNSEIQRLLAAKGSTEEQIMLLSNLSAEEARRTNSIRFVYEVRRRVAGLRERQPATLDDAVKPGDTIVVTIDRGGLDLDAAALSTAALERTP